MSEKGVYVYRPPEEPPRQDWPPIDVAVDYAYGGAFRASEEQIARSQEALERASVRFKEMAAEVGEAWPYQFRPRRSRRTGLTNRVQAYEWVETITDPEAALDKAYERIRFHEIEAMCLGTDRFEVAEWLRPAYVGALYLGEEAQRDPAFHVHLQQYHGELPVYGGSLGVHLASEDFRMAITSSCFPVLGENGSEAELNLETAMESLMGSLPSGPPGIKIEWMDVHFGRPEGDKFGEGWYLLPAPYAGQELLLLPHEGAYHPAYRFELVSSDDAWRIFVDAVNGDVLGRPQRLLHHAQYYATTAARLGDQPTTMSAQEENALEADVADFMLLEFHPQANQGDSLIQDERLNVAFHANRLYRHFVQLLGGEPQPRLRGYDRPAVGREEPGLRVRVGAGGTHLATAFVIGHFHPRRVNFQTVSGGGLAVDNNVVNDLALDGELVMHEMAHGLMWLLKPDPFEQVHDTVPFARALTEGYATYFARSVAERQDGASSAWARAAYREADWGARWSLDRPERTPGADLLPEPNLYPDTVSDGSVADYYDVGMVWARALWDVRTLLGDPDLADRLALEAYEHVVGWLSDFEMAAEGLIDAAQKDPTVNAAEVEAIINLFRDRGIVAERPFQALARFDDAVLAGGEGGVFRSTTGAPNSWQPWGDDNLSGVVALAAGDTHVYAATETGVFRRDEAGPWEEVGDWPAALVPLSLLVHDDQPFVGTSFGVWHRPDGAWEEWAPVWDGETLSLERPVLALASVGVGGQRWFHVATGNNVRLRRAAADAMWQSARWIPDARATTLAAVDDVIYAGTLHNGVWKLAPEDDDWVSFTPLPAAVTGQVETPAVLHLASGAGNLYIGTTSGLFRADPTDGDSLARVNDVAPDSSVMAVLPWPIDTASTRVIAVLLDAAEPVLMTH